MSKQKKAKPKTIEELEKEFNDNFGKKVVVNRKDYAKAWKGIMGVPDFPEQEYDEAKESKQIKQFYRNYIQELLGWLEEKENWRSFSIQAFGAEVVGWEELQGKIKQLKGRE